MKTIKRIHRNLKNLYLELKYPDFKLRSADSKKYIFAFTGEFGYELISWIPYLKFIKEKTGMYIETCSRKGSSILYYFSDKHHEIEFEHRPDSWGFGKNYRILKKNFKKRIIYPVNERLYSNIANQKIIVDNYSWKVKDIHNSIDTSNYSLLDCNHINIKLPFKTEKKIVIINNKSYFQWNNNAVANFFNREELIIIKKYLLNKNYFVVYNHFKEEVPEDFTLINDEDIFVNKNECYDMNCYYTDNINENNKIQIELFKTAEFVIAPQGGSVYLPAICKTDMFILMRKGYYIDFLELKRIYDVNIDVFYEVKHLISFMENRIG